MALRDLFPGAADDIQAPERLLRESFGLDGDEERLPRLAIFVLAHVAVDRFLIMAIGNARRVPRKDEDLDDVLPIFEKAARGTFKRHLDEALADRLISTDAWKFARDLNTTRDEFVHWVPGRPPLPMYKGHDVTTAEGLRVCLKDVLRFMTTGGRFTEGQG